MTKQKQNSDNLIEFIKENSTQTILNTNICIFTGRSFFDKLDDKGNVVEHKYNIYKIGNILLQEENERQLFFKYKMQVKELDKTFTLYFSHTYNSKIAKYKNEYNLFNNYTGRLANNKLSYQEFISYHKLEVNVIEKLELFLTIARDLPSTKTKTKTTKI